MVEISERYILFGKTAFIKQVAIPVGSVIEAIAKEFPCSDEKPLRIEPRSPTASISGLEALIGIVVFLGAWAGNKFLDEIYEAKFSPAVKELLNRYIERGPAGKKYSLAISIRSKDQEGSVLICCVGRNVAEIEASEAHIPTVLSIAERHIGKGNSDSVYMYIIENGNCNLTPTISRNYNDALEGLKRMYPAKLPRHVRNDR